MSRKDHEGNSELNLFPLKRHQYSCRRSVEVSFGNTKVICNASMKITYQDG